MAVADAQVWTVIALLAAAMFAIVIEMRRMNDRMTDGFAAVCSDLREFQGEVRALRAEVAAEVAAARADRERRRLR